MASSLDDAHLISTNDGFLEPPEYLRKGSPAYLTKEEKKKLADLYALIDSNLKDGFRYADYDLSDVCLCRYIHAHFLMFFTFNFLILFFL